MNLNLLVGSHLLGAVIALGFARRLGRRALLFAALGPLLVSAWIMTNASRVLNGEVFTTHLNWVGSLGLTVDLRVDAFSLLMLVLVAGVGLAVFFYSWHYFGKGSATVGRFAGLMALFAGAMVGVVLADNLLVLYVFWELTSITSYLLIGLEDDNDEARDAARQALLTTVMGGLCMLFGLVLLGQQAGTFSLSGMLAAPPSGTLTAVALVLVLVGAFTKSAQYPFHAWLPRAMVAPTPISSYLHSAAMVKAGIYLVARLAPAFADVGIWRPLVVVVGLTTMIAGGMRALLRHDLKQLLAFGTISQLGFLMVLFGVGKPAATAAGCALLLAHGLFKAALFLVVGILDHQTGTRDLRLLPTLGPGWALTKAVAVLSSASMAAVPLMAGFLAKEQAYDAFLHGTGGDRLVLAGIVVGSVFTVAYSCRFVVGVLAPSKLDVPGEPAIGPRSQNSPAPALGFVAPAALMAAATAALGVFPALWSRAVDRGANALDANSHAHLALWHGLNTTLALSLATLATGLSLFALRHPVARFQQALRPRVDATSIYNTVLNQTLALAGRVTRLVQPGSLPFYVGATLVVAVVAPAAALMTGPWWSGAPSTFGKPAQIAVAAMLVVAAVATTLASRRFHAVLLLGAAGYGMALLFVVQGAPDLALTQFGVETLFVVVFLLVLKRLPDRFQERPPLAGRMARMSVSLVVGVLVVVLFLAASGARNQPPVSTDMAELAQSQGHGRNVVNVILVDIRGFDTVGEISVLVAAGVGIGALARRRRA